MNFSLRIFFLILVGMLSACHAFGEGTKEIMPDSANAKNCRILITHGVVLGEERGAFALYLNSADTAGKYRYRLYIHISDWTKEKIYFGIGAANPTASINWRIHKPDDSGLEWSGTTPTLTTQKGFIDKFSQAYAGPKQIATGGYDALVCEPKSNGDYFMTFQVANGGDKSFQKFDVSVIDTTTWTYKKGRVFSKGWQFNTNDNGGTGFFGGLYIYSKDGIVSKFDPNGFQGAWFTITCNESGCFPVNPDTNAQMARRSVNFQHNYPQYKVFLNNPDTLVYPSGTIGQLVPGSVSAESHCSTGTIDFIFETTAAGTAEITLELNTLGAGYANRILIESTTGGVDTVTWDGKDANGVDIPSGSTFNFILKYYNGLTHLPLYDVETNTGGFKVSLFRPQSNPPLPPIPDPEFFWCDTLVNGADNSAPPGCMSSPTSGCHAWSSNFGNVKTMNTWWYVVSTSIQPLTVTYKKGPQDLGVIAGPDAVCAGATAQFLVSGEPNSQKYYWTYPGGSDTTLFPFKLLTIPFSTLPGPAQITVRGYNTDCGVGPISTKTITINAIPMVTTDPLSKSICNNNSVNVPLAADVAGATFQWRPTASLPAISGYANGGGTIINDVLINSGNITGTVDYRIIPTANGCEGDTAHFVVTVFPKPNLSNATLTKNICNNTSTNTNLTSDVAGTLFTWTVIPNPNVTGQSDNLIPGTLLDQTLTNLSFTNQLVTFVITPRANNCDGDQYLYRVTVYPKPDLSNSPKTKFQCDSLFTAIPLLSDVTGTAFTWTCTPTANISGYSNNAAPAVLLDQILDNTGFVNESVTYHMTPTANGCDGDVTDYIVTVYPSPDLSNSPKNKYQCNNLNTNITLTSNVAGTLFTWSCLPSSGSITGWSNNGTPAATLDHLLVNSGFITENVKYTITPIANGCSGKPTVYTVYVYPTPDVSNAPLNKTICSGILTGVNLTSNVAGTSFTWTTTPSSGSIGGFNNGSGLAINDQLINSGFSTEYVTYHIIPTANGCSGLTYDYRVYVTPVADAYFQPLSQTICTGQSTNIDILSHVTGTTFTWTASGSAPTVSGFFASSGTNISQPITSTGTNIETVTYTITPTISGCQGTQSSVIVTVNPSPAVIASPPAKTICSQGAFQINLSSAVSGSTFAWTATASSPNLSGFSANSGSSINQTVTNSGYTIETVTYLVSATANTCQGPVTPVVLTVNPVPDVSNNPLTSQICSATSPDVSLTSNVAGATFSWTTTASSGNVIGYSNSSGTILNQVLTNLGLTTEWVTYHITPTANGCPGLPKDFTVTIVSIPDVYFQPPDQTICSQQQTSIQNLSHVAGAIFSWTVTASSPNVSGYSNSSGNTISQTLFNSGATTETATYTVSPAAYGCPPGIPQSVVVTILPRPTIINTITTSQICSSTQTGIVPQSTVPNTTYSWTASGSSGNVTGFSNNSGLTIVQTLVNSGYNIEGVTYNVTPTANTCAGITVPFMVTVFPVADIYFTPANQTFCSGGMTSLVLASHVAGASYTWTASGSSANITGFFPSAGNQIQQVLTNSGTNIENVTYTVTPAANGCTGTSNQAVVTVNPLPVVNFTSCWDPVIATNAQPVRLKGATPAGGTYSGTGVTMGIFYPALAGIGTHTITYNYTNTFTCGAFATQSITIADPLPFTCGGILTDIRDNMQYQTVQFVGQCWMTTNLQYGSAISSNRMQRDNCVPEKYCLRDNALNCTNSGGLYQWDELMGFDPTDGNQGLCPSGWHIPKESDWAALFNQYVSSGFAGSPLKFDGYSGFNAFLTGTWHQNIQWDFENFAVMFWSSTAHGSKKAWAHGMNTYNPSVSYYPSLRSNAFSVRCIKD